MLHRLSSGYLDHLSNLKAEQKLQLSFTSNERTCTLTMLPPADAAAVLGIEVRKRNKSRRKWGQKVILSKVVKILQAFPASTAEDSGESTPPLVISQSFKGQG